MKPVFSPLFTLMTLLHGAGLSLFLFHNPPPLSLKLPPKKVAVHTVQLKKEKIQEAIAAAPPPVVEPEPVPVSQPEPKPEPEPEPEPTPVPQPQPKAAVKAKEKPKGQPKPKPKVVAKGKSAEKEKKEKAELARKQGLLREAQKNLQAISSSGAAKGSFKVAKISLPDSDCSDTLSRQLKEKLVLPEFGEVKINLILTKSGKVVKVEILESESKKNSALVKKVLGETKFFPFGNHFGSENERSFVIVLSNDI